MACACCERFDRPRAHRYDAPALPLPTLFLLAFASGVAAALASRRELRLSPRPAPLTAGFGALALYLFFVVVPVSLYFYWFHGDWAVHYLLDVQAIPSAVALVGFVVEVLLGGAGFVVGASLVRAQREAFAGGLLGVVLVVAGGLLQLARARLAVLGSFAQFHGGFGLSPYGRGTMLYETVAMSLFTAMGLAYLLARLAFGARRAT
jgi:hypothetical protein